MSFHHSIVTRFPNHWEKKQSDLNVWFSSRKITDEVKNFLRYFISNLMGKLMSYHYGNPELIGS